MTIAAPATALQRTPRGLVGTVEPFRAHDLTLLRAIRANFVVAETKSSPPFAAELAAAAVDWCRRPVPVAAGH